MPLPNHMAEDFWGENCLLEGKGQVGEKMPNWRKINTQFLLSRFIGREGKTNFNIFLYNKAGYLSTLVAAG